jgi:hypothetical protein
MRTSGRGLLEHLIDYAGLFPPAKLPLDEALRNDAAYRQADEGWMLGRFVCPVGQLADAGRWLRANPPPTRLAIAALARPVADPAAWSAPFAEDLATIAATKSSLGRHAVVDVVETPFPADAISSLAKIVGTLKYAGLTAYLETPADGVDATLAAIQSLHTKHLGMKLRCGGVAATAFPSSASVASFLARCAAAHVPCKMTAGLHHPLPHFDEGLKVRHHGFINVFLGGLLAFNGSVNESELVQLLDEQDPAAFRFAEYVAAWRGRAISVDAIRLLRQRGMISFGSCSIDEPVADLRALGLLP